jgi:hypothetical protein
MFLAMTFYDGETVVPAAGGEPRLLVQLDDPSHGSVRSEFAASAERFYFTVTEYESDISLIELSAPTPR